jgi:hypothetical protein
LYSTDGAFPTNFGQGGDSETSLSNIALILGKPGTGRRWPSLRIERTEFWGVGVIDGDLPYFDGSRLMAIGEEFDLGFIIDGIYLVWSTGNIGMVKPDKTISGFGFEYSIGAVRLEQYGVKYDDYNPSRAEIDYELESYGMGVMIKLRYGTMPITNSTNLYFQANAGGIATGEGGMLQCGYELGFLSKLTDSFVLRTYAGGYFWPISNWGDAYSDNGEKKIFGGIETDYGYMLGLQLYYVW